MLEARADITIDVEIEDKDEHLDFNFVYLTPWSYCRAVLILSSGHIGIITSILNPREVVGLDVNQD